MKSRNIGLGIFIICIGALWLLMSLDVINWSVFDSLYDLWPLVFVAVGLSILFRKSSVARVLVWVLFIVVLVGYGVAADQGWIGKSNKITSGTLTVEKSAKTQYGNLDISLGDTNIQLNSGTNDSMLVEGTIPKKNISRKIDQDNENALIKVHRNFHFSFGHDNDNDVNLRLNKDIIWDIKLGTGDLDGTLDLAEVNTHSIEVNAGDSDLDLKLGSKNKNTRITINAGDSDTKLSLPDKIGVRVTINAGDYDTNMGNLSWVKNGHTYTSTNYDSSESKVDVTVNMGDGNFNVNLLK